MSYSSSAGVFSQNAFLNPGPAPAPPDHPSKITALSDAQFQIPPRRVHNPHSSSDSSTFDNSNNGSPTSTSSSSTGTKNKLNTGANGSTGSGRFIKHGWTIVKEDGSFKLWNKKYLVLRENCLEFYKSEVSLISLISEKG